MAEQTPEETTVELESPEASTGVDNTIEQPKAVKKGKKAARKFGDPIGLGDHIVFTAAYPTFHPFDNLRYEPGARYETVITEENSYTLRLLQTGTFVEIPS